MHSFTVEGFTEDPDIYHISLPGVSTAADMYRGQSLVVWAIRGGCARAPAPWTSG